MAEELTLVPYSIVKHEEPGQPQQLYFWVFKRGDDPGKDVGLLRVYNVPTFIVIELPATCGGRRVTWDSTKANLVVNTINAKMGGRAKITKSVHIKQKLLYYHRTQPSDFVYAFVEREGMFDEIERALSQPINVPNIGMGRYSTLEGKNIPLSTKFLTLIKLNYSQYFSVQRSDVDEDQRVTTTETAPAGEWKCDYREIKPIPLEDTTSWVTYPTVLSIDGEMHSENENRFPSACRCGDSLHQISMTFQNFGTGERKSYLIVDGPEPDFTPNPEDDREQCEEEMKELRKYQGMEVIRVSDEIERIRTMAELINKHQPTLCIGYNVFFDWKYIDDRLKRQLEAFPRCSRIPSQDNEVFSMTWKSSAYSVNSIVYPQTEGRIHHDILTEVKRDFKLTRYTLGSVAKEFLGEDKVDTGYKSLFRIKNMIDSVDWDGEELTDVDTFDRNLKLHNMRRFMLYKSGGTSLSDTLGWVRREYGKACRYAFFDSILPLKLFERLNSWINMVELSNIVKVSIDKLSTRGQQIRVISQIYQECKRKGYVIKNRNVSQESFSGAYVYSPVPGLYSKVLCLDFASLYPMIIVSNALCYTSLVPPEHADKYDPEKVRKFEWSEQVEVKDPDGKDLDDMYDDPDGSKKKFIEVHNKHVFVKSEHHNGILPDMVYEMVKRRRETRERIKHTTDLIMKKVLDARQLALKVGCNSIYGFTGTGENGMLPCREISKTVTYWGRHCINKCSDYVKIHHGEDTDKLTTVYGDTDSVMIGSVSLRDYFIDILSSASYDLIFKNAERFLARKSVWPELKELVEKFVEYVKTNDPKIQEMAVTIIKEIDRKDPTGLREPYHIGKHLEKALTAEFEDPMAMEYENCYARFLILTKKRYCALKAKEIPIYGPEYIDENGKTKKDIIDHEYKIMDDKKDMVRKGVITAKRTECTWLKELYDELTFRILKGDGIEAATNIIFEGCLKMMQRQVSWEDLVVVREYSGVYKSTVFYLAVFGELMKKKQKPIKPGERLDLLYVVPKEIVSHLQGYRVRTSADYLENAETEPIDYKHYITNMCANPIEQVYKIAFKDEIAKSEARYPGRNLKVIKTWYNQKPVRSFIKICEAKESVCRQINGLATLSVDGSTFVKLGNSDDFVCLKQMSRDSKRARKAYRIEIETCKIDPENVKALPERRKMIMKAIKSGEMLI